MLSSVDRKTVLLPAGAELTVLPGAEPPGMVIKLSPYLNVEDNIARLRALDWRNQMDPRDREWLDRTEAPLRALGYEPLIFQIESDPE